MLEQETHNIIQTLSERAIGSAQSLSLKDALAADLPKSIKMYLQCEVTRWLQDDLKNASRFSNVRFATPSVQQLTRTFMRALASEYIFTREEFARTLENAVHFVENYLCRPQWTLDQFVFEKSERVTKPEMREKLEHLSDYLYFGKLIQSYVHQKGWQEIGVEAFRTLVSKLDEQVVKQHRPRELAQLTRPIFEFFLLQTDIQGKVIPIRPLLVFFEDKKMIALKEYIERICHMRSINEVTIAALAEILEDLYSGAEPKQSPPPETSRPPTEAEALPVEETNTELPIDKKPGSVEQELEAMVPDSSLQQAPQRSTPPAGADRRNIPLSLTFSGMTEATQSPSPIPDFRVGISEEQRERFIRAVFHKDEAYYDVVMESLNAMTTWRDASLYLQTFYQATGIDPHSQDVVEFTDLIQNRYASAENP